MCPRAGQLHEPAIEISDATLDRLASAVHHAAHWLPPWSDPLTVVVAAGFEPVVCSPTHGPAAGRRRVSFDWDPSPQVRGLRIWRAFARVLLREILGVEVEGAAEDLVDALAARLAVPAELLGAARRSLDQASQQAPRDFVMRRLGGLSPSKSGTFAAVCDK